MEEENEQELLDYGLSPTPADDALLEENVPIQHVEEIVESTAEIPLIPISVPPTTSAPSESSHQDIINCLALIANNQKENNRMMRESVIMLGDICHNMDQMSGHLQGLVESCASYVRENPNEESLDRNLDQDEEKEDQEQNQDKEEDKEPNVVFVGAAAQKTNPREFSGTFGFDNNSGSSSQEPSVNFGTTPRRNSSVTSSLDLSHVRPNHMAPSWAKQARQHRVAAPGSRPPPKTDPSLRCAFCLGEDHDYVRCPRVHTYESRRACVHRAPLCFFCLERFPCDHECFTATLPCSFCRRPHVHHHPALCSQCPYLF